MPVKNSRKHYQNKSAYHVYVRGRSREDVFREEEDYVVFLSLCKRYLSPIQAFNVYGRPYISFYDRLELLAYCLMTNHIHMLVYQEDNLAMQKLLQRLLASYSMYFNAKYFESGPVFESRYKAKLIDSEPYYLHISRYIHMNPKNWEDYSFSSLRYYTSSSKSSWLRPSRVLAMFRNKIEYLQFLRDYDERKSELALVKYLAEY